jgi:site-specific recombinase XerD
MAKANPREFSMMKWIGAASLAVALMSAGAGRIESAAAAPLQATGQVSQASKPRDASARRRYHRYAYRRSTTPYDPHYYARPTYYAPYPYYVTLPFGFTIGIEPSW